MRISHASKVNDNPNTMLATRGLVAAVAVLALLVPTTMSSAPAQAAEATGLTVSQSVTPESPAQNDLITLRTDLECWTIEGPCLDASLAIDLSDLEDFTFEGMVPTVSEANIPRTFTWKNAIGDEIAAPNKVIAPGTHLIVDFPEGMPSQSVGQSSPAKRFGLEVLVKARTLAPGEEFSGTVTALATASNSTNQSAEVVITMKGAAATLSAPTVTLNWPSDQITQTFSPGRASKLTATTVLAGGNVTADSLVIHVPEPALADATDIAANNWFRLLDFDKLTLQQIPVGASGAHMSVYVVEDGKWIWMDGPAFSNPVTGTVMQLPVGINAADVAGVRVTYTGAIATNARATFDLETKQRSTDRRGGAALTGDTGYTAQSTMRATVRKANLAERLGDVNATYTIQQLPLSTTVQVSASPSSITVGETYKVTGVGTNTTAGPVNTLSISHKNLNQTRSFNGFVQAPTWPEGATNGIIEFDSAEGKCSIPLAKDTVPPLPAPCTDPTKITSFTMTFSSDTASITQGATAHWEVNIKTSVTNPTGNHTVDASSSVTLDGRTQNSGVATAPGGATRNVTIVNATVNAAVPTKKITPGAIIPGDKSVVELQGTYSATASYVTNLEYRLSDQWDGTDGHFWNFVNLVEIPAFNVPGNVRTELWVRTGSGATGDWTMLDARDFGTAGNYELSEAALQAAVAAKLAGKSSSDITGVEFRFKGTSGAEIAINDSRMVRFAVVARSSTRIGSWPGSKLPDEAPGSAKNVATATINGKTRGGADLTHSRQSAVVSSGVSPQGGGLSVDYKWVVSNTNLAIPALPQLVSSRAATQASLAVNGSGNEKLVLQVPATLSPTANSEINAVNLVQVYSQAVANTPFAGGWYLKYDKVSKVEAYYDGGWHEMVPAGGSWHNADSSFKGVAEAEFNALGKDVMGTRLTITPDDAARTAAQGTDPYAPKPGTGVISSPGGSGRYFYFQWQLRDKARTSGDWVTYDRTYNGVEGVVNAMASLTGTKDNKDDVKYSKSAPVTITASPVAVGLTTVATPSTVKLGYKEGMQVDGTLKWNNIARTNNNVATHVRMTDPVSCPAGTNGTGLDACKNFAPHDDPFGSINDWMTDNPKWPLLDRFNLTKVTVNMPATVDPTVSTVWLLKYSGGTFSTTKTTLTQLLAMGAEDLKDVVGVSVSATSKDWDNARPAIAANSTLQINYEATLRDTIRRTGEKQLLAPGLNDDISSTSFAQTYNLALTEDRAKKDSFADAKLRVTKVEAAGISSSAINTVFTPTSLKEINRGNVVTAKLEARSGTSSLAPKEIFFELPAGFFETFDLVGASGATATGANTAVYKVYGPYGAGGAMTWVEIDEDVDLSKATGLKITLSNGDGNYLVTDKIPSDAWTATATIQIKVRDTLRTSGDKVSFENNKVDLVLKAQANRIPEGETGSGPGGEWKDGADFGASTSTGSITLVPGTRNIQIAKQRTSSASAYVGDKTEWLFTVKNVSDGFITLAELRDILPVGLIYVGEETDVVFTPGTDAADPGIVAPVVSVDNVTGEVVFDWPTNNARMKPYSSFTIALKLEANAKLKPGAITNNLKLTTKDNLNNCARAVPNVGLGWSASNPKICTSSDQVTGAPVSGPFLYVANGVVSDSDRGGQTKDGVICAKNVHGALSATEKKDFYGTPCAAVGTLDSEETWLLQATNVGSEDLNYVTLIEDLPSTVEGRINGTANRGTTYRPQMLGAPTIMRVSELGVATEVTVPYVLEVTSQDKACSNKFGESASAYDKVCATATWRAADNSTDWSTVKGLRLAMNFSSAKLKNGETIDVTYQTKNVLKTAAATDGMPIAAGDTAQSAWSDFAAYYGNAKSKMFWTMRNLVGTTTPVAPLSLAVEATGNGKSIYLPRDIKARVSECQLGDQPVTGVNSEYTFTLDASGKSTPVIINLPMGASCTFDYDTADHGQTGLSGAGTFVAAAPMIVDLSTDPPTQTVPEDQVATLKYEYATSTLEITKSVDSPVTGLDKDFTFEVSCLSPLGKPVDMDDKGAAKASFTLKNNAKWESLDLPVGAVCAVTETGTGGANKVDFSGDNLVVDGTHSNKATVTVGTTIAKVKVTNYVPGAKLTVQKKVAGEVALGAAKQFSFTVKCDADKATVVDQTFTLAAGGSKVFETHPVGTECTVTETDVQSAHQTAISSTKADGTVGPTGTSSVKITLDGPIAYEKDKQVGASTVVVSNTYKVSDVKVTKAVAGEGSTLYSKDSFDITATCSWAGWDKSNVFTKTVTTAAPTATFQDLPVGASCDLTETKSGGATSSTFAKSTVTIADNKVEDIALTNTFDVTTVKVTKELTGSVPAGKEYEFELSCARTVDGQSEAIAIPGGARRTVTASGPLDALYDNLPVGASCSVVETEGGTPTGTVPNVKKGDLAHLPKSGTEVTMTTNFDGANLTIGKSVSGEGAVPYGANENYTLTAVCYNGTSKVLDKTFTNQSGKQTQTEGPLPVGSTCVITADSGHGADAITWTGGTVGDTALSRKITIGSASHQVAVDFRFDIGSLQIAKTVDGAGKDLYGTGREFTADVSCTWIRETGGNVEPVVVPGTTAGKIKFTTAGATIHGLPVGARCSVEETRFGGASSHSAKVENLAISATPAKAALTNTFDVTTVRVTKELTGTPPAGKEYDFTLTCTRTVDDKVESVAIPGGAQKTVTADSPSVLYENLPVGAACSVVETEGGNVTGTLPVTRKGDLTNLPKDGTEVTMTTNFAGSSLNIVKSVSGAGAVTYGNNQAYSLTAVCDNGFEQTFMNQLGSQTQTVGPLPVGATCMVSADSARGAHGTTWTGGTVGDNALSRKITIGAGANQVAVDFRYDIGDLKITKALAGEGTDKYAAGRTFVAEVVCTWDRGGSTESVVIPGSNDGKVDFRAMGATVQGLPVGAVCSAEETGTGAASSSSGKVQNLTIGATPVTAAFTNTYDLTKVTVTKELLGDVPAGKSYDFTLACTLDDNGVAEPVSIFGARRTVTANSPTVVYEDLPVGASCSVVETEGGKPTSTLPVTKKGDLTNLPKGGTEVTMTTTFVGGNLTIGKSVSGEGAAVYGADENYSLTAVCVNGTQKVLDKTYTNQTGKQSHIEGPLPLGTTCTITADSTHGAHATAWTGGTEATELSRKITVSDDSNQVAVDFRFDIGDVQIAKTVDGDGKELYFDGKGRSFAADVACTWDRGGTVPATDVDVPGTTDGNIAFDEAGTAIKGLPVGAVCSAVETLTGGASWSTGKIENLTIGDTPVTAAFTNTYKLATVTVEKVIDELTPDDAAFTERLSCTLDVNGAAEEIEIPGGADRVLSGKDGLQVVYDNLPVGAKCTLEEIDNGGGGDSEFITEKGDLRNLPETGTDVKVVGKFDGGFLKVNKTTSGEGAADYGQQTHTFDITCDNGSQTVVDTTFVLDAQSSWTSPHKLPTGTICVVAQEKNLGAHAVTWDDGDNLEFGKIVIKDNRLLFAFGDGWTNTLNVDFRYDVGELQITKVIAGEGESLYSTNEFAAEVLCTWDRDGDLAAKPETPTEPETGKEGTTDPEGLAVADPDNAEPAETEEDIAAAEIITIPGLNDNGLISFDSKGTTVKGLPVGAVCSAEEVITGGATSSSASENAEELVIAADKPAEVTFTNVFALTSIDVGISMEGEASADSEFTVDLACTREVNEEVVDVTIPGGATKVFSKDAGWSGKYENLPVGAACTITQSDTITTNKTTITVTAGEGEPRTVDGSTAVLDPLDPAGNTVKISNTMSDDWKREVIRYHGPDRYGTSADLNQAHPNYGGILFVATGQNFPDALTAAPAVIKENGSLVLTKVASLPASIGAAIRDMGPSKIYIVGGREAVSENVVNQIRDIVPGVPMSRLGGADRYETSQIIYQEIFANDAAHAFDKIYVATGRLYPDALVSSASAGSMGSPVLLVRGTGDSSLPADVVSSLKGKGVTDILIAGGQNAVSAGTETSLRASFSTVLRHGGVDRYATNMEINDYLNKVKPEIPVLGAWLATGNDYADALSGSVYAGKFDQRLFLSRKTCIPAAVGGVIDAKDTTIRRVSLVGGPVALSAEIEATLRDWAKSKTSGNLTTCAN